MKRDVTRTEPQNRARGPHPRTTSGSEAPVRTLRARPPLPLLVTGAVASLVALLATAEITATLVGSPLHHHAWIWFDTHGHDQLWATPETMLASALLMSMGLTVVVLALVPARGDWLALCDDGVRPADGVPGLRREAEE
ncbi:hypothetical protein [Nocardiopsis dassonvillei]|uniref:Uncharacterized protein n=2 Tax=Nocardiopsidaceae TaxID=83676 RepID=D7B066_NOCDD|nr:hypothetical protein [Nocardiopsis dassonvillei]ADH70154.1 hypothetical protein Ndas_4770 [Nocardiopsis dassonvillei subsp. dassonvillei DSM 43111]APC38125.1 hypothetical protein A9R04_27170 [Nocardiopsis dassonvillei]NKY79356.1 hypothetical protein [Nocardiopsis dassonvillei]VEI90671.1 Uncharacterised protein [Nocardiopsis dassonvillei]